MKYDNDRLGAALKLYLGTDPLPMHMPGGKRNPDFVSQAFMRDITEIEGFDNLHSPTGLLKDLEDCAASLWNAENAFRCEEKMANELTAYLRKLMNWF